MTTNNDGVPTQKRKPTPGHRYDYESYEGCIIEFSEYDNEAKEWLGEELSASEAADRLNELEARLEAAESALREIGELSAMQAGSSVTNKYVSMTGISHRCDAYFTAYPRSEASDD